MKPFSRIACSVAAFGATLLLTTSAGAWLFHEHTRIGRRAVERLSPGHTAVLARAWAELRGTSDMEPRLCAAASRPSTSRLVRRPGWCIDFPMLAAIAADFSCSPGELLETVAHEAWLKDVVEAAYDAEGLIAAASDPEEVVDAWHANHIRNFRADPEYLSRAASNQSHFSLMRVAGDGDLVTAYLQRSLLPGQKPNAFASYALYHTAGLRLADRHHRLPASAPAAERARLLRTALFAEAFALHFLEDSFASGHAVGTTGDTRERTGTHDYYSEHGIEARPWTDWGEKKAPGSYIAHGDAFVAPEDVERAASAVQASLADFLGALESGFSSADRVEVRAADLDFTEHVGSPGMNACLLEHVPAGLSRLGGDVPLIRTLFRTYMPVFGHMDELRSPFELTESSAELARKAAESGRKLSLEPPQKTELVAVLPRFHALIGPFFGLFASARYGFAQPVGVPDRTPRFFSVLEAGLDLGIGLDGITTSTSDAFLFLQVGVLSESAQLDVPIVGSPGVPDRTGFVIRWRLPFYVVPGDLLLAAALFPLLPRQARTWIVQASEDGLFGLEQSHYTPIGAFQLVLGREASIRYLSSNAGRLAEGWGLELPVVELRPRSSLLREWSAAFSYQAGIAIDLGETSRSVGGFLRVSGAARRYPAF